MPCISVIVPVYNTEKYLRQCLDSILAQTFKDFELILVDDGSKDGSGQICDEYAEKDNRINVIHKQNAGVSVARNIGIEAAKGSYIMFVDSDDWVDEDILDYLYNNLTQYDVQIITCYNVHEYINYSNVIKKAFESRRVTGVEAKIEMLLGTITEPSPNYKLMQGKIIKQISFPDIKYAEDMFFMYEMFSRVENVLLTSSVKYHYRQRKDSAARTYSEDTTRKLFAMFDILLNDAEDHDIRQAILYRMTSYCFAICTKCPKIIYQELQKKMVNILMNMDSVMVNKNLSRRKFLLKFPFVIFRILYFLHSKYFSIKKMARLYSD